MTSGTKPEEAHAAHGDPGSKLPAVVARLAGMIAKGLDRGEAADLRRMSGDDLAPAAFWRLFVTIVEPAGWASAKGASAADREAQWATIFNTLAIAEGLHSPQRGLGRALAEERFSELRFTRLLRAQGPRLADELRLMARFLASKGASADLSEAARLVLTAEGDHGENVRRRIARDYYSNAAD